MDFDTDNGELKIEKGIPVPPKKGFSETLRKLKVGDSLILPIKRAGAYNAASYALGRGNYTCRAEGKGFRIWRIK